MRRIEKLAQLGSALACLGLVACGGGDSGEPYDAAAAAAAEKYVGTYVSTCTAVPNQSGLFVKTQLSVTQSFDDLHLLRQWSYYTDPGCNQTFIVTLAPPKQVAHIQGQKDIGSQEVDKIRIEDRAGNIESTPSSAVSVNSSHYIINYTNGQSQRSFSVLRAQAEATRKDVWLLDGNSLTFGRDPLDADGYPTQINTSADFNKTN